MNMKRKVSHLKHNQQRKVKQKGCNFLTILLLDYRFPKAKRNEGIRTPVDHKP